MGFFSRPDEAGSGSALLPPNRDRIEACMKANDWVYRIDDDGDVGGMWGGNVFFFLLMGKEETTLQIRGRYRHSFTLSQKAEVLEVLDRWHDGWIFPKGYTNTDDEGRVWVMSEHSVDLRNGASDADIDLNIGIGIHTALSMYDHIKKEFGIPDDKYDED